MAVADPAALYLSFAESLRAAFGKLPAAGIPRILRPRKKHGTVDGFSVVDPGGKWLRFSQLGDPEEATSDDTSTGLERVIDNAARLGDAKGDTTAALRLIDNGLARYDDAHAIVRARALLYRVELTVRIGEAGTARSALAEVDTLGLSTEESSSPSPTSWPTPSSS